MDVDQSVETPACDSVGDTDNPTGDSVDKTGNMFSSASTSSLDTSDKNIASVCPTSTLETVPGR